MSNKKKASKKYWYKTEVEYCVLCGREKKYKFRVFEKPKQKLYHKEFACAEHFI